MLHPGPDRHGLTSDPTTSITLICEERTLQLPSVLGKICFEDDGQPNPYFKSSVERARDAAWMAKEALTIFCENCPNRRGRGELVALPDRRE